MFTSSFFLTIIIVLSFNIVCYFVDELSKIASFRYGFHTFLKYLIMSVKVGSNLDVLH